MSRLDDVIDELKSEIDSMEASYIASYEAIRFRMSKLLNKKISHIIDLVSIYPHMCFDKTKNGYYHFCGLGFDFSAFFVDDNTLQIQNIKRKHYDYELEMDYIEIPKKKNRTEYDVCICILSKLSEYWDL